MCYECRSLLFKKTTMADHQENKIVNDSEKSIKSMEKMDRIDFEQISSDIQMITQQGEEINNNEDKERKSKSESRTRFPSFLNENALDIHVSENHLLINHQRPSTSRIYHPQHDHHIMDISSSSSSLPNAAPVNAVVDISLSSTPFESQPTSLSKIISNRLDNHNDDNVDTKKIDTVVVFNSDNHAQQTQQPHNPYQQQQMIRTISIDQQPTNILEIERINLDDDDDDNDIDKVNKRQTNSYRHRHRHRTNNIDTDDTDDDGDRDRDIRGARDNFRRLNNPISGDADGIRSFIVNDSRRQSQHSSSSNQNIDYLFSLLPPNELNMEMPFEDPIQIRGNGNITLFGLSNCYESSFPSALLGRVSKEEFEYTIGRINHLLQQQHSTNIKFLLLGCLCCCFSLGCSLLWPGFALSRRTKNSLEKVSK